MNDKGFAISLGPFNLDSICFSLEISSSRFGKKF